MEMGNPEKTNSRKRLLEALSGKIPDRLPRVEISFWPETIRRWREEGLPPDVEPADYFGLDRILTHRPFDCSLMLPTRILQENQESKVEVNSDGVTIRSWKNSYAPPSEVGFSVRTHQEWKRLKGRFDNLDGHFCEGAEEAYRNVIKEGCLRTINPVEPMWYVLRTLGFERALEAVASEPEFIDDILVTCSEFILKMMALSAAKGYRYDAVWFFSDLCYKNGMLFSPRFYRERLLLHHRRISDFCKERGMRLMLHCDGDVRGFIPLLLEAGFNCIQPLEARAGNDVRELKKTYGTRICFFGNISMDVLARGDRREIEEEVVSKVEAAKAGGGYIYHSDHSVPPTVSLENYRFACQLAKEHGAYQRT